MKATLPEEVPEYEAQVKQTPAEILPPPYYKEQAVVLRAYTDAEVEVGAKPAA